MIISFSTVAASIATCVTVFSMREERNQAYKPYFIFRPAYYTQEVEKSVYSIYDVSNLIIAQDVDDEQIIPMTLMLENIGSGTATNIEISFSCGNEKEYMEEICKYYDDNEVEFTDKYLKVTNYLLNVGETIRLKYYMDDIGWSVDKSYIYTKEGIEIVIPEEYRKLLYVLAFCTNGDYEREKIPSIEVSISYNDLQGIDYYEKFILKAEVYVDLNSDEKKNFVEYRIEELKKVKNEIGILEEPLDVADIGKSDEGESKMEDTISKIIVALVSAVIGFMVGLVNNKINLKQETKKERLTNFYIPFVKLYDSTHMAGAYNFLDFSEDIQKQYVQLLVEQKVYAPQITREYITQFMMIYHEIFSGNELDREDQEYLNKTFNTISQLIYGEYNYLSNQFYYDVFDRIRNWWIKRKFKKYAENDAVEDVFMNNL